jgi:hypothetical protein
MLAASTLPVSLLAVAQGPAVLFHCTLFRGVHAPAGRDGRDQGTTHGDRDADRGGAVAGLVASPGPPVLLPSGLGSPRVGPATGRRGDPGADPGWSPRTGRGR